METWNTSYPDPLAAPLGLKGWHAAFLAVGIPGILMAIWVRTLREPTRGVSEGLVTEKHPAPYSVLMTELMAMVPIFNLIALKREGASLKANLFAAISITVVALFSLQFTDHIPQ